MFAARSAPETDSDKRRRLHRVTGFLVLTTSYVGVMMLICFLRM